MFSGTFGDALWTIVAFVALVVVLGKTAWKPLLKNLNARQNHIAQQLKAAEDSRVQAEHLLEDYKQQGLGVIQRAMEQAQHQQQQAAEKTREETQVIRRRAQEEIESARAAALEELWRQAGDIVLGMGSKVIGRALTPEDNQRLIDEAVGRIRQNGGLQ
ncbi:MAG: ATP synthase F0 subunit B [Planctomycetes bacterium RBG_13_60_9]|nr:MAG: ATP synthase F0 subunit B [Planctomycetes bacterium RBG_13_60_9]